MLTKILQNCTEV